MAIVRMRARTVAILILCLAAPLLGACKAQQNNTVATVVVDSRPEKGAEILLNGTPTGKTTPATFTGLPTDASTLVQVSKEGYKTAWRNVTPVAGRQSRVVLDLEAKVGYLSVDSEPPGAEVVLDDGTVLGRTPLAKVPVQVGVRNYEVRADRFQPAQKTFQVEEYYTYSHSHVLSPKPARIEVMSRPSAALIFINDQFQGKRTPATFELVPGTYTISVDESGYVTTDQTVTVGPGDNQTVMLEMAEGDVPAGMVLVPAGEFIMGFDRGAPDEQPQRKVEIEAFYIDKYEVTNQEFKRVFPDHKYERGKENHPVTGVTWEQADSYARTVGKRLPTEEEWEKAARGTDGREYPWGNRFEPSLCNSSEKPNIGVEAVGEYRGGASPYGCMDMAGNAFEWTASWYNAYPGNTAIEKDYGQMFRVLRGGSYRSNKYDIRCASRHYDRMTSSGVDYGFRCAQTIASAPRATNASAPASVERPGGSG
jgi:formylglycine-generating enzyme required for sulfatase activity